MFASSALLALEETARYHATLYGHHTLIVFLLFIPCSILSVCMSFKALYAGERIGTRRGIGKDIIINMAGAVVFGSIAVATALVPDLLISMTPLQEKIDTAIDQAHTTYDRVYDEVMTYASSIHVSDEQECPQRMDASHQYICTQMSQHIASIMPIEHETTDTASDDKEWLWRERTRELRDKQKILKEDINRYHNLLKEQE